MSAAKCALMLLAIDRGLKGALISGAPGSAKSLVARSFQALAGADDRATVPPFVELPLNATEDQLLGGLDLEATLAAGKHRGSRGALARADDGALYVDGVNLLDAAVSDNIAAALEDGVVRLEREGISESHSSRFVFIGTSDPAEGEVSANLRDRVALLLEIGVDESPALAGEIVERALEFDRDPCDFVAGYAVETAAIKAQVREARLRLERVAIAREDISRIVQVAMSLGVQGNRADIFAVRAARASAALAGRDSIGDDDIVTAIKLVLLPRATTLPDAQPRSEMQDSLPDSNPRETDSPEPASNESGEAGELDRAPIGDLIIRAIGSTLPDELLKLEMPGKHVGRDRAGSGKRARTAASSRGRYIGVMRSRQSGSRVAVDATLRAAAPHQITRRAKRDSGSSGVARIQTAREYESRVDIAADDLRYKRFKRRSGALFIFAVDASGSMAVNRMAQTKGAIARLLGEAYLHRDKVALISFRGSQADVLLAPTRSVELAKRLVDVMPTGGATPLAAGLLKALELSRLARLQGMYRAVVLLMTDGRANVALTAKADRRYTSQPNELKEIGAVLKIEGVESVVIDTRSSFVSSGDAGRLAEQIGARYLYLPRADALAVYKAVAEVTSRLR
ncbi:MAG TPA: magnesium chelatase ATPase subunit D [Blastocatellia bacterium]|nr:magnesium chelatase ATPase subunit D [Blastocatellia bacterium]